MLIKWIACQVREGQKQSFSRGQEQWRAVREVDGFLGQAGGWNVSDPAEAVILAFWRDEAAYRAFMANHHDPIFAKTRQQQTYERIRVELYERVRDMPGTMENVLDALAVGKWLRLEQRPVLPEADSLAGWTGAAAGVAGKAVKEGGRFLVATVWNAAQPDQEGTSGAIIAALEDAWLVLP
jgi:heme-degrading monooxygenase HmoA